MKNWLKDCNLTGEWKGNSFVVTGKQSDFEDWMYIQFEMVSERVFRIGGMPYMVFSYHNTDDIIIVKAPVSSRHYCLINLTQEVMEQIEKEVLAR